MLRLNLKNYVFFLVFAVLLFPIQVFGEEKDQIKPEPESEPELCIKQKIKIRGRPNRISAMASMNAVIQWINQTKKKHGAEYAQWHTAKDTAVSCEKIRLSDYHICFAAGKPCKKDPNEGKKKGLPRKKNAATSH
ncbi:MAG: hypothetical protein ACRBBN_16480 [Methyloligellaceae bacterium]